MILISSALALRLAWYPPQANHTFSSQGNSKPYQDSGQASIIKGASPAKPSTWQNVVCCLGKCLSINPFQQCSSLSQLCHCFPISKVNDLLHPQGSAFKVKCYKGIIRKVFSILATGQILLILFPHSSSASNHQSVPPGYEFLFSITESCPFRESSLCSSSMSLLILLWKDQLM